MGSPANEPERRPGENQVDVTISKGFWTAKYEATQGQWKRVVGALPGPLTAELTAGDDFPVGNVDFAEAEAFCQRLSGRARQSGGLPKDWEFRLPTDAQWEYACRAGATTTAALGRAHSARARRVSQADRHHTRHQPPGGSRSVNIPHRVKDELVAAISGTAEAQ